MRAGFGPGSNGPLVVTADLTKKATNNQAQLNQVKQQQASNACQQAQVRDPVCALDGLFLTSHIRERWHAIGHPHEAVIEGLAGTARVIISAAMIMAACSAPSSSNGDPNIKQFGLVMAAAVAIDATIVRCLLVPP